MAKPDSSTKREVITGVTPIGVALWPKLFEPDCRFKEEGEYSVKLKLSKNDAKPLVAAIEGVLEKAYADAEAECSTPKEKAKLKYATPCYEEELDDNNKPTGFYLFRFKAQASYTSKKTGQQVNRTLAVFDAQRHPIVKPDYVPFSGTEVRVAYELIPFNMPIGIGCSCRMTAVQIIKLVEMGRREASDYGFGVEDGGFDTNMDTVVNPENDDSDLPVSEGPVSAGDF